MVDRGLTFADPEIVQLLRTRFVPLAIDEWYLTRQKDAEGEFFRKVATQEPSRTDLNGPMQGIYAFTADGKLLGFTNHGLDRINRVKKLMADALMDLEAREASPIEEGRKDAYFVRTPPAGGLIVAVTMKVLGGFEKTDDQRGKIFQQALGRDNLWVRNDEAEALARGQLPQSLKARIARFHLFDNTRGDLDAGWVPEDVKKFDLTLDRGALKGSVTLATASRDRTYDAELLGFVEVRSGKVTRFDLVFKGNYWMDWSPYGPLAAGAPKARYPLAVAFTIADEKDAAAQVPPTGSRVVANGYLR